MTASPAESARGNPPATWTVVLPVKALDQAKSRLRGVARRPQLALAFAIDTATAATASALVESVVVVTDDTTVRSAMEHLTGVRFVSDPGVGLNAAIAAGLAAVSGAAVVIPGDLPALTTAELEGALSLASVHPLSMVADHSGEGTTFLAAEKADALSPRFGRGSRRSHEDRGHVVLAVAEASSLRWDVDTAADLAIALRIGVGPATARALAEAFAG